MSLTIQIEAVLLAVGCIVAALLSGALARYRRDQFTRPQGAVRASFMLFLIASAINAIGIDLDWPLPVRITPMLVVAYILIGALVMDLRYEARVNPGRGPMMPLAEMWRRIRRR